MQKDMHYYGTYAIARAAGIPWPDAQIIAYSAQYVDDSTKANSEERPDGSMLHGIATAHTNAQSALNAAAKREEQRLVWVPFHFLPGGKGDSFQERLCCVKDSEISQQMLEHHLSLASKGKPYGLELTGIAAHVYMDTFAHYGFSGISSERNDVKGDSIEYVNITDDELTKYLDDKKVRFLERFGLRNLGSSLAESASSGLGHGGVFTHPDRPYLHWRFTFENQRADGATVSDRNNPETFFEGCQKLHGYLSQLAAEKYRSEDVVPFEQISDKVESIIRFQGKKQDRIEQWVKAHESDALYQGLQDETPPFYDKENWEQAKRNLHESNQDKLNELPVYRFHQAAAIHRYYVLKDLLPSHGLCVY